MHKIEYRVRPITRYIVTRWETEDHPSGMSSGGCSTHGEFENEETAYQVGYALAHAEHDRLGWPLDDERIQYPDHPSDQEARRVG